MSGPKTRDRVLAALKVALAAAIIGWLVNSGALDLSKLELLVARPALFAGNLGIFFMGIFLTTARWSLLLSIGGIKRPFGDLLKLQLTAVFFNLVIPGGIGGDVLKAVYIGRDEPREKLPTVFLVSFVERLLGLASLLVLASAVTLVRFDQLFANPLLKPFATSILLLGTGTVSGILLVTLAVRRAHVRILRWTGTGGRIKKLFGQVVAAIRLLSSSPQKLALVIAISMTAHAIAIGWFTVLARAITGMDVTYGSIASTYPLGILTLALPIAPAGMGVGHAAFEALLSAIGIRAGATIYNTYVIGQMVPNLTGAIPYLMLKRRGDLPTETELK